MIRPNILLITTDQQRFDTIAALGNSEIFTPHLNWLVDQGIAFTRCYTDCPICMPARATIMTGLAGYSHGLLGNYDDILPMKDRDTLASLLTKVGYQTRAEGKLHFNPMRTTYGIEHADLPIDYFNEMRKLGKISTRTHGIGENEIEPIITTINERDTLTHWTVDKSIDFIENHDPTRPFFLWTSFAKPHPPLDPCISYWELYRDAPISEPIKGDWSSDIDKAPLGFYEPTFQLNNIWRMSAYQKQQIKKAYYACISQIDYNLGLLFARMRELNLLENTWIVFTSDHGEMLGDHNMGAKSIFLEGSAHIPFIIKPPAEFGKSHPQLSGLKCDKLISLADLMPTILSICTIETPKNLDGVDLLEHMNSQDERTFYGNCDNTYFVIIKENYKYTWTAKGGQELLFDLANDPYEKNNLCENSDYATVLTELKAVMLEEIIKTTPQCVDTDGKPKIQPVCQTHNDVPRFPGFNTTLLPRDSFH